MPAVSLGGMDMLMVVHIDQAARVNADLSEDGSTISVWKEAVICRFNIRNIMAYS